MKIKNFIKIISVSFRQETCNHIWNCYLNNTRPLISIFLKYYHDMNVITFNEIKILFIWNLLTQLT